MGVSVKIDVDTRAVERDLGAIPANVRNKVIPASVNRTADEALRTVRGALPQYFQIRNAWVGQGLRTTKATPSTPAARLYHKDAFMARQEFGGEKDPKNGGHVAIPILGRPRGDTSPRRAITRPAQWPSRLKNAYVVPGRDGELLVFQRPGRKGRRPKGTRRGTARPAVPSRLMYILAPRVRVPKRWHFLEQVTAVVNERWQINARGFLDLALAGRLR